MSKASKPVSEIDRLIELASDEKPRTTVSAAEASSQHSLVLENEKDSGPSMWRVLIQLRVLLPYLAKVLPLVERGLLGTNITGQATGHAAPQIDIGNLERGIAGVGEAQRDLKTALNAQTAEFSALQEKVAVLTQSVEKGSLLNEELATNLASLRKLTTASIGVIFALLAVLIALVAYPIFSHS